MAEFRGKQGHWVTTESGSHIFIESGKSFEEAISDAFGKENVGKYKKHDKVKEVIDKMTENGTKEVNLNAGTISRASNGELTEEEVHKWFEENDELEDYEAFDDDNDFENWEDDEEFEHKNELTTTVNTLLKEGKNKEQIKNYLKQFSHNVTYTDQMDKYVDKLVDETKLKKQNEEIDYENITYPKGTSKEYTNVVNKKYQNSLPILEKAGIKLEDFGGKSSLEGGFEDNTKEIMDKYVFEPFRKKYPKGNNDAWEKEYQPLYDAIEAVADKKYNDWWIKNKR